MAEVDCWCIHACDKQTREIVTFFSKRERSYVVSRYFVDFQHGISVFANFSYGFAVLVTPPPPPPMPSSITIILTHLHYQM